MKQIKKGFTLIELLIVVSIIGILAVALIPNFTKGRSQTRDASRFKAVSDVVAVMEAFNADYGRYPSPASATLSFCMHPYWGLGDEKIVTAGYFKSDPPSFKPIVSGGSIPHCEVNNKQYIRYSKNPSGAGYSITIYHENERVGATKIVSGGKTFYRTIIDRTK